MRPSLYEQGIANSEVESPRETRGYIFSFAEVWAGEHYDLLFSVYYLLLVWEVEKRKLTVILFSGVVVCFCGVGFAGEISKVVALVIVVYSSTPFFESFVPIDSFIF